MEQGIHFCNRSASRTEAHGFGCTVDRELFDAQYIGRSQSDALSQSFNAVNELIWSHAVICPAPLDGSLAIDAVASNESHFLGAFRAHQRYPKRRNISASHRNSGLANPGIIRYHGNVCMYAHLRGTSQTVPMNGSNDGFWVIPHCKVAIHITAQASVVGNWISSQAAVGARFAH